MRRLALIPALILAVLVSGPAAAQVNGVAIDSSTGVLLLGSPTGAANCKAATTGAIRYNSTIPRIEFCDGTAWKQIVQTQTSGITAPAGSGYFVLSYGGYGTLGGMTAADATCLTDLTTHTGWMGYSTANSNGQLASSKVHAFLCGYTACNNLMPLTTYYFANAGNGAAGGASFTTNANGAGPGDSNSWAAANYFSGTYKYWVGNITGSSTLWGVAGADGSGSQTCSNWTSNWWTGNYGTSAAVGSARWNADNSWNDGVSCDMTTYHLICYVNP